MPFFRALLIVFGLAVAFCAVQFLRTQDRRYLRWIGRLFATGLAAALAFFAVLSVQRLLD
jgi:dolichyl-phosphate-mannose--protein O-mannosyl transferase